MLFIVNVFYIFLVVEIALMGHNIRKNGASKRTTFHLFIISFIFWMIILGLIFAPSLLGFVHY